VRTFDSDERRARLAVRHHLASPAHTVEEAAAGSVGLHSSDPVTVFLSCRARLAGFVAEDLEAALYERRTLVRMLGMRRTMFVVPVDLAAVMDAACTQALAPPERARLGRLVEEQGVAADGAAWLAGLERRTLASLDVRGEATASELTEDVPELGIQLAFGQDRPWAGTFGVSTRLLFLLAAEGKVLRGRPRGTWRSSQYRWARVETWLGGGLDQVEAGTARADLARRWLGAYGPGFPADLRWWTGWTARATREALERAGAIEVELDGRPGVVLADDLDPAPAVEPWAALLPSLDPTVMGWKERAWYLGDHAGALFDTNGNAGPTVWWAGRVVGGWAQRPDGEVVVRLLEDVGAEARARVADEAGRLGSWLGDVRLVPRFRTPLDKELAGG
jgi:hypothetical protein